MLADYLNGALWQPVMTGVRLYQLPEDQFSEGFHTLSEQSRPADHLEVLFCRSGSGSLRRWKNPSLHLSEEEILLCSDRSDLRTLEVSEPLGGWCISIDRPAFRPAFETLCRVLGHNDLRDDRVSELLDLHDGCLCVHNTAWNQAAFAVLSSLPEQERGRYCVLKIVELLYLLCAQNALLDGLTSPVPVLGHSPHTICRVRAYMESHLDEKLTISVLSRRFHLSATALKNGFRSLYGQPIHSWLQDKRLRQAAELLQTSNLSILQIAQSVGYEGVSQFNVAFKQKYDSTPSQFRKMSNSMTF